MWAGAVCSCVRPWRGTGWSPRSVLPWTWAWSFAPTPCFHFFRVNTQKWKCPITGKFYFRLFEEPPNGLSQRPLAPRSRRQRSGSSSSPASPVRSVWVCRSCQRDAGRVAARPTSLGPPCLRPWTGAAAPTSPRAGETLALGGVSAVRLACAFFPGDWGSSGRGWKGTGRGQPPRGSQAGERGCPVFAGAPPQVHTGDPDLAEKSSLAGADEAPGEGVSQPWAAALPLKWAC